MIRAEVVGSMLRPPYLKQARAAVEQGTLTAHEFKRVEDRAVDQVIALQEGAGLDVVSDGEMRRFLFMGPITETVSGIEPVPEGNAMPWATSEGRSEIQELVALGCGYIQVDAPELATLVDPRIRDWAESLGMPAERMLSEGIELINGMVEGISGVHLGIHLCRGNNVGMWMASGGYDYIAKALFERATAFDAFLLEYDDARSGSFEPLAQAPDDKQMVLGLVSTKTPREETAEELIARIEDAALFFPREQLGLSTQCGFASVADGNPISEDAEERKLRLVADVAHAAWG
jgi:methionine synthase II (cobalamin-independent)